MKIAVCIKRVPDMDLRFAIGAGGNALDPAGLKFDIADFDGYAVEAGLQLVEKQPPTTWSKANPREYGFYSNVNPAVDHPRWSQASERRIGESGLFVKRRPTLPFNGYGDQVAGLYSGLDLKANY